MVKRKRIAVTGGSGRLGTQVIKELMEHDYEVKSLDIKSRPSNFSSSFVVNLNCYDKVISALEDCDAVIHLAAYPDPVSQPNHFTFSNNVVSTYNVLEAASMLGITKVVLASSESSYGFPWAIHSFSPNYLPVDENHPQMPQECYGLSKVFNEITGEMFFRRTGMQVVTLRFSTILTPEQIVPFTAEVNKEPANWKRILWSYIDIRDAAAACRLAFEGHGLGAVHLNITADNTCCDIESKDLLHIYFPEISDIRRTFSGFEALYSNVRAKRMLQWQPVYLYSNQKKD